MAEVARRDEGVWGHVGTIGGALVSAYAGYLMTRFEPKAGLPYEKHMKWPVKVAGYVVIAYAVYDGLRSYAAK